jgi:activator of Hsp90 ATPase-like protein
MTGRPEGQAIEQLGRIIRAEIRTKATPQQAYDAWADPERLAHWFPDRAEGKAEPGATITWIFDKFDCRIPCEVLIGSLRQKMGVPLARNLSKLIRLGNFFQAKARKHSRMMET